MTEESASPSQRAGRGLRRSERRTKGFERREAVFDLFVSGFSHQQIATALKTSSHTVRRIIDTAVADRRLDAPGALRPRSGRAAGQGALPCRPQARAGRHEGVCALSEDSGRARPLPRPRRARASAPPGRRSTTSCRPLPRSPFPIPRPPTRPRTLQILAAEMPEPHSPRPEAPRRARRQRYRWKALSLSRKADHGATVYILRCADGGYFTGVAQRTAEDRPGEHPRVCSTTPIPSAGAR